MKRPEESHRFLHYSTSLDAKARECELTGEEHHHVSRVLRMRPGDATFVTNGRGVIAECIVDSSGGGRTLLTVERVLDTETAVPELTLAAAVLKKDAFEQIVRQCTELGVTRFIPYHAEKCHLPGYSRRFAERLGKIAVEAMKQSFRAWLPVIEEARTFADLAGAVDRYDGVVVGDPDAPPLVGTAGVRVLVVVGPEAGLSAAETGRLRDTGCMFASAGPGRLRSETAAAALVARLCSRPAV
jgi:16S rRNA (uracil1498-N3)-methyltransferase